MKFFAQRSVLGSRLGGDAIAHALPVVLVSLAATAVVLGLRHFGSLQFLELSAYDRLMQSRPELEPDPRLLVVGITEQT